MSINPYNLTASTLLLVIKIQLNVDIDVMVKITNQPCRRFFLSYVVITIKVEKRRIYL